jgi:hypothetical protein
LVSTGIDAAWIGAAGVLAGGFVAIIQSVVNGRSTRQVAEVTIQGEHRQRLWEKQSAAYEDAVKEVLARRIRREALTSGGHVGDAGSHPLEELLKAEEPESIQLRAALRAYASEVVWAAYEAADKANTVFWVTLGTFAPESEKLAIWRQTGLSVDDLPIDPQEALADMDKSKRDAGVADDALFKAINRELAWNPAGGRT